MNLRRILVLVVAVILCAAFTVAQQQPQGKQGRQRQKQVVGGGESRPAPSPEMKKLAGTLIGNWKVEEKHEAMGPMPAGSSTGLATFHRGPGGLSVVENFNVRGDMGRVVGMGILSWDPKAQLYKAFWCDNMTPSGCEPSGTGKWEGDKLVMTSETDEGGKKMSVRETYSDITPDSFTFTMEGGEPGGQLKPFMTIKYTRSKPAATPAAEQKP